MHLIFLSGTPLLGAASSVFSYSCVQFRSKQLLCWDIPLLRVCSEYCLCNARPCAIYIGIGKPCQNLVIDVSQKTCIWYFWVGRPLLWAALIVFSYSCVQFKKKIVTLLRYSCVKSLFWIVYAMPGLVFDCKVELGMLWHATSRAVHRASWE